MISKLCTVLPKYEVYMNGKYYGVIEEEYSLISCKYHTDFNDWHIKGSWGYFSIVDTDNDEIARIVREPISLTKTYNIDVGEEDRIVAVFIVLAIAYTTK